MRIDDLVFQSSVRKIWSLGDVEELLELGSEHFSPEERPELTKDSERAAFSASVGSRDDAIVTIVDLI